MGKYCSQGRERRKKRQVKMLRPHSSLFPLSDRISMITLDWEPFLVGIPSSEAPVN